MIKAADRKGRRLIIAGVVLIVSAAALCGYNLGDDARAGRSSASVIDVLRNTAAENLEDYKLFPDMEMPEEEINGVSYIGRLQMPTLDLELPVVSDLSKKALRIAPCRYAGSAYNDTLVVGAHNYRTHFGKIRRLQQGDQVVFTDVKGNAFLYGVTELEVLQPDEVEKMTKNDADLTLFTCTLGGASRVTVRCDKISE